MAVTDPTPEYARRLAKLNTRLSTDPVLRSRLAIFAYEYTDGGDRISAVSGHQTLEVTDDAITLGTTLYPEKIRIPF